MTHWTEKDQKAFEFYGQFIRPGDTCFNIGANIGHRTKIFLRLGATVIAVEPQDQCLRLLREIYGNNNKLELIPSAVGEAGGQAE